MSSPNKPENETPPSDWASFIASEEASRRLNEARQPRKHIFEDLKITDIVIAAGTFLLALTGFFQWAAIRGQLKEMRASGKQTDQLICEYPAQIQATNPFSNCFMFIL
jgi:hypothetical protein